LTRANDHAIAGDNQTIVTFLDCCFLRRMILLRLLLGQIQSDFYSLEVNVQVHIENIIEKEKKSFGKILDYVLYWNFGNLLGFRVP
jgi:hypothetical protein